MDSVYKVADRDGMQDRKECAQVEHRPAFTRKMRVHDQQVDAYKEHVLTPTEN